jgi:hypothetical protein
LSASFERFTAWYSALADQPAELYCLLFDRHGVALFSGRGSPARRARFAPSCGIAGSWDQVGPLDPVS